MSDVLVAASVVGVPLLVVFAGCVGLAERFWRGTTAAAPAFAVLGTGIAALIVFIAFWLAPPAGMVVAAAVLVAAGTGVWSGRVWRLWRSAVGPAVLVVAWFVFAVGFTWLWGGSGSPFDTVSTRFYTFALPSDSQIPHLFALRLADGASTQALVGDWNGGDRPPLQSGLELLLRPLAAIVGDRLVTAQAFSFVVGVAAQLLWTPAAYSLLRLLSFSRPVVLLGLGFVIMLPTTLVNSMFTWPKSMSAAYVIASAALVVFARRTNRGSVACFALGVLAAVLGLLAHGGAAFTAPILIALGIWSLRGRGVRTGAASIVSGAGLGLIAYVPWALYQRLADPPGDRLLLWHLAGVTSPTNAPFLDVLRDQYATLSVDASIANRLSNLQMLVGVDTVRRFTTGEYSRLTLIRTLDWTSTAAALGLIALGLLVTVVLKRVVHRSGLTDADRPRWIVILASLGSVIVWALVLYSPNSAIVPHGSQVWLILLAAIPFCMVAGERPGVALALAGLQGALLVAVYWRNIEVVSGQEHPFTPLAAIAMGLGLAAVTFVLIHAARTARTATAPAAR